MGIANLLGKLTNTAAIGALALVSAAGCSPQNASLSKDLQLGDSTTAIVGGSEATGTEDFTKSIVSLINTDSGSLCTASILSDKYLVTAAHCVDGPAANLKVIFGTKLNDAANRIVRQVSRYEVSPLWATRSNELFDSGDIAVVEFEGGLAEGFRAAKLLKDTSTLKNGDTVLLSGYGISDAAAKTGSGILRFAEVKIEDVKFSESEISVDQRPGSGACHGDSGGPAFAKVGTEWVLWGVTNRGINDPQDLCSVTVAYASVPFFKDWIAGVISDWETEPVTRAVAGF